MSFRSMLPTLLLAFALSIFVCVLAAARGSTVTLALAAGLFAVQVLFALLRINVPLWRAIANPAADFEWAWSNTMLTAFAYAWGATAMFAIYSLTGLAWRHWWQYGAIWRSWRWRRCGSHTNSRTAATARRKRGRSTFCSS
jgi:hypothetical protein